MHKLTVPTLLMIFGLVATTAVAGFEGPSGGPFTGDPALPFDSFDAVLRIEYGVDDNVQLAPDQTGFENPPGIRQDTESQYLQASFNGTYRHRFNQLVSAGIALVAAARVHLDEINPTTPDIGTYDDYDTLIMSPRLFMNVNLEGVDLQLYYQFRHEEGQNVNAIGLNVHTIGLDAIRDLSPTWRIRGGVGWTSNDYSVDFLGTESFNDRDSVYFRINAGVDYFIQGGRAVISGTVFSAVNDSDGLNWNYTSYGANVAARTVIVQNLFASASVGIEHRDYDSGFTSPGIDAPGRTEQDIISAEARLTYSINDRFSVDAFVQHTDIGANSIPGSTDGKMFEGDQTVYGVGLNVKLY